jgi:DNA polymerase III subunit epsilon
VIVIAHNSGFDRKIVERYWTVFEQKAWGCSATEIDWRKLGFAGAQLGYLLTGAGFFHHAHRAVDDCHALLEVLAYELPSTDAPALALRWRPRASRRCAYGPNSLRSNSRTR